MDTETDVTGTGGLQVDPDLRDFVAEELVAGLDLTPARFWAVVADLQERFGGRVEQLLRRRDELQQQVDDWHREHGTGDVEALEAFLTEIGYLLPVEEPTVRVTRVDREIAEVPGPQLVVPATVPRYALNAANARWGSLYDALYGTDALPLDHELEPGYDERRGAQVIAEADRLLDQFFPLAEGSHADVVAYRVPSAGELAVDTASGTTGLADPAQFAGHRAGDGDRPAAVLLRRHGLHLELTIDPSTRVGTQHHAGVSDALLESAVSTIVDLEDSVATVDGPDKVGAYRSWLGLRTGELTASFGKGGRTVTREVHGDRTYVGTDGGELTLPGRSLLLVRNVGHHMRLDAVRTADGEPILEEVLDALVSATAALQELRGNARYSNTRTGSVYIVKPKMHGPDEVSLSVELLAAVEEALGMEPTTLKIGIMDEEKRTSINLEACIARAADRVIFVNTGFLDRTGDEIHTDFEAGPVVRKDDQRSQTWLKTYEDRNVDVALRAGFAGQAQIGKGMWAKPAAMREMLDTKGGHPRAGANTAWVPSPTAATLHALHYLETDVLAVQEEIKKRPLADRRGLLVPPVLPDAGTGLSEEDKRHELETNAQSILGYVVRWVGLGIGCSTVPTLEGVGLMEDRATLRISSQQIANWLHHGLVTDGQVRETFARMAEVVDGQNADEPGYAPMCADLDGSPSFQAALDLVFSGRREPNGYTERALTTWRQKAKATDGGEESGTRAAVLEDEAPSPAS
ncbi:malate synthase G [Geodermatophilus sp. DSM 44513]|uniref:malate synthase G n=1 Tax=Geodermatophilus sp. DSM 44513 TaxID=1528104 RepID=UPI001287456B|nr:malate synthase G [Geodermatophilus sp. DSM 44513]WNV77694.1 malate synthase G [Geodermatophilus sp. DSM 44513]